jgi:hypothetical protein
MTTKKREPTQKSFSSKETDQLKASKDVLALGRVLVKELRLDPGVDTLGRWMAHHIAELIRDAEKAPRGKARVAYEVQAADAIIKLWQHRSSFENRINPIFDLKPIVGVIRTLDPNNNDWLAYTPKTAGASAKQVYDGFRRLMIFLLISRIMSVNDASKGVRRTKQTAQFQSAQEGELIRGLETWIDDFVKDAKPTGKKKSGGQAARPNVREENKRLKMLVVRARKALDALETEAGITDVVIDEEDDPFAARLIRLTEADENL